MFPLKSDSLVLYKQRPGRVVRISKKKIDVQTDEGTHSVRHKDVIVLHQGPLTSLNALRPQVGEVLAAWELLAGTETTLPELTELVYGSVTPASTWAAWQLVDDRLYFSGEPDAIVVHTAEEVAAERAAREARIAEERAWQAFLQRLNSGRYDADDYTFLQEVEALALGQRNTSRVLKALNRAETWQGAHELLLSIGYWKPTVNPYPTRAGVAVRPPAALLPPLADEPRRDLTHLAAFAIDDAGSSDPDDAISWDGEHLWVHIADAAALIAPNSEADEEARARGATLYLPEGTTPMLPEAATAILGIGLTDPSPALSFALRLTERGTVEATEIVPSWVSVTRISYEEAEGRLDEEPLRTMRQWSRRYTQLRHERGAAFIELPEVKVQVSGERVQIVSLPSLISRDLVRDAMLMAGEGVARYALAHNIPVPFSTQEKTDTAPDSGRTMSSMYALRRSLRPSQLKITPGSHGGLGMDLYTQSTSPLRRYLDLVVHQQLRAHLRGEPLLDESAITERIALGRSAARAVRRTERLSNRHWSMVHLLNHGSWSGWGVVVEQRGARSKVILPALGLEVDVYAKGHWALDDEIEVELTGVDLPNLEATFQPL